MMREMKEMMIGERERERERRGSYMNRNNIFFQFISSFINLKTTINNYMTIEEKRK